MKPQNFAEKAIWISIIWTYGFYAIGGLYILGSVLAWILLDIFALNYGNKMTKRP
jgi:hypothetical protein